MPLSIGKRIAKWRKVAGLTPTEFSRLVGVRPPTVWGWEHDKYFPSSERLKKIAKALGLSLPAFFGDIRRSSVEG